MNEPPVLQMWHVCKILLSIILISTIVGIGVMLLAAIWHLKFLILGLLVVMVIVALFHQ